MAWGIFGISGRAILRTGALAASLALSGCFEDGKEEAGAPGVTVPGIGTDLPKVFSAEGPGQQGLKSFYEEETRARLVPLSSGAFDDGSVLDGSKRFVFNLFDDAVFPAEVDRVEMPEAGRFILYGRLAGMDGSWFTLSSTGGLLSATVYHPLRGWFEVEPGGDGLSRITEFAPDRVPVLRHGMLYPDGTGHQHEPQVPGALAKSAAGPAVIDILVVYTAAAANGAGGAANMKARIDKAVAEANAAFVNSRIDAQLRLVYSGQVNYTESGNMGTDLGRLQKKGDGFLDDVPGLRETYKADLASLVVEQAGGVAGIGYVMTQVQPWFKDYAYTVVGRVYTGSYNTLAHEVGHNLGCAHDRQNSSSQAAYPYSYGYRFTGSNGVQYRDIMAYAPGTPIPHYSNPNVLYMNVPTGIPDGQANSADNARTINQTAATAAAFYAGSQPPVDPAWTGADIGAPAMAGSHAATATGFNVSGAGADIWGASDQFRFVSRTLNGDGEITARVVSLSNTDGWAKAGVMIRESSAAGARHAFMAVTPANGLAFQRRAAASGPSTHTGAAGAVPRWVRLKRAGNVFTASVSADGNTWTVVGSETIAMGASSLVGLAVTSHNAGALAAASFESVTVR